MNNEFCILVYHEIDNNVFETCLKTLRNVSDCNLIVFSDCSNIDLVKEWSRKYKIDWRSFSSEEVHNKRAACKVKYTNNFSCLLDENSKVIIADVDLYFVSNPFESFTEKNFDMGVTTRAYHEIFPINGGVYFYRINEKVKKFLQFFTNQVFCFSWDKYAGYRKKFDHEKFGLDWTVGQDFLNCIWLYKKEIFEKFEIVIEDLGPKYNFCLVDSKEARKTIVEKFNKKEAAILHLKSQFKEMVYSGELPNCVTKYPRCGWNWLEQGTKK